MFNKNLANRSIVVELLVVLVQVLFGFALPAANAQTLRDFPNLQNQRWLTCGSCGDSGGSGSLAKFSATNGANLFTEGETDTKFTLEPGASYENAFFWQDHGSVSGSLNLLIYSFDIYPPAVEDPQAIEFQIQQQDGGLIYNGGWQADYAEKQWRTFDYQTQSWVATDIPFAPLRPGQWHTIVCEYQVNETSHTILFYDIWIDHTQYVVNISRSAVPTSDVTSKLTSAFQLDGNEAGTPYSVYFDRGRLVVIK